MSAKNIIFLLLAIAVAAVAWHFFDKKNTMFMKESEKATDLTIIKNMDEETMMDESASTTEGEVSEESEEMMEEDAASTTEEMTAEEKAMMEEAQANIEAGGSATDPNEAPNAENTVPASI